MNLGSETNGISHVVVFVCLSIQTSIASSGRFAKPPVVSDYVVTVEQTLTGHFLCKAGIVTLKTVITTCNCVGEFAPPDLFEFHEKDLNDLTVVTSQSKKYKLKKVFINPHCRPSRWNYTVNNLGGWMVVGSFGNVKILHPVFLEEGGTYKNAFNIWDFCFVQAEFENGILTAHLHSRKNQLYCLDFYCSSRHLDTFDCLAFQKDLLNSNEICSMLYAADPRFEGTPTICRSNDQNRMAIYGAVGLARDGLLIWTRIDSEENEPFVNDLLRGRAGRNDFFRPLPIAFLIKCTITIFQ